MNSVLKPSNREVYPNEVKATAAFVLGEFRSLDGQMLLWNIDLQDEKGVCTRYYATASVQDSAPDSDCPCAVALIKLGERASIDHCLTRIAAKPNLSQKTRDRIARVLMTIDKKATKEAYEARVTALQRSAGSLTEAKRQEELALLLTIEPIVSTGVTP
jgi:hypothetical protein